MGHCSPTHIVSAIPDIQNVVDEIRRVQSGWYSQEGGWSPVKGDTEEAHTGNKFDHLTGYIWRRRRTNQAANTSDNECNGRIAYALGQPAEKENVTIRFTAM